jgi:TetR/AcrR family transcriptional regulator, cholesterol catabolism regulator
VSRRLTSRGRRRRQELLDYAAGRFAAQGYHPTSVTDITDGLGVAKGVFYWYFESKEALFAQILIEAQRDLRRSQKHAVEDEPDPLRRIEQGIRATMNWLDQNRNLFGLLELARTEETFAPLVRQGEEQAIADTLPHVKAAIAAGFVRKEDPIVIARAILGVTQQLARAIMLEEHKPASEVADSAVAFCLGGVSNSQASPPRSGAQTARRSTAS